MAFLIKEELRTVATPEMINLITNNNDQIVNDVISESIDVMSGYLYEYYDVAAIFDKLGDQRNLTILKHLKAITIFEVCLRRKCPISKFSEDAKNEALTWLEKVAVGKIKPPLPSKQLDNGNGILESVKFMKLGSRKKYDNHF